MIKFLSESFREVREEALPFIESHAKESMIQGFTLDLNTDLYDVLEDNGGYVFITARDEGELVGYCSYFVGNTPHNKNETYAQSDSFYLVPEHRKGWNFYRMMRYAKTLLMDDLGVDNLLAVFPVGNDLGPLFTRLGYEPIDWVYRIRR